MHSPLAEQASLQRGTLQSSPCQSAEQVQVPSAVHAPCGLSPLAGTALQPPPSPGHSLAPQFDVWVYPASQLHTPSAAQTPWPLQPPLGPPQEIPSQTAPVWALSHWHVPLTEQTPLPLQVAPLVPLAQVLYWQESPV